MINSYERAPHTSLEGMKRLQVLLTQINPKIADVRVENLIDNSFMSKLESSGYIQSVYKNSCLESNRLLVGQSDPFP